MALSAYPIEAGGALKDIIEAPSLDDVRALDARTNIGYAVQPGAPSDHRTRGPRGLRERLRPRALRGVRPVRPALPRAEPGVRDLLPKITTPTQIVAGRNDELVPWSNNQYLHELYPTVRSTLSTPVTSPGNKPPTSTAALIADWVSGGYRHVNSAR